MTRRQIRENLYKMLFQVEFHDKDSLKNQMNIYLEDLEGANEKDRKELTDKFNELVENLEKIDAKIEAPTVVTCPNCGAPLMPHRACTECGFYKGKEAVKVAKTNN